MTIADLLARATSVDPSRPAVTFYDLTTGERVELSLTTCTNWVAKTANMLQDTLGSDEETVVDVLLPVHWETVVWFLATWSAGAALSLRPGHGIAVVDPATLDAAEGAEDVIAFCRANLAGYKVPRTVIFGSLPKTSTGKIQKFVLRERAKELG